MLKQERRRLAQVEALLKERDIQWTQRTSPILGSTSPIATSPIVQGTTPIIVDQNNCFRGDETSVTSLPVSQEATPPSRGTAHKRAVLRAGTQCYLIAI